MIWTRRFFVVLALLLCARVITGFCDDAEITCDNCPEYLITKLRNIENAYEDVSYSASSINRRLGQLKIYVQQYSNLVDSINVRNYGLYEAMALQGYFVSSCDWSVDYDEYYETVDGQRIQSACFVYRMINSPDGLYDSFDRHYLETLASDNDFDLSLATLNLESSLSQIDQSISDCDSQKNNIRLANGYLQDLKSRVGDICNACSNTCSNECTTNCPPAYITSNCVVTCAWDNVELVCITNCIDTSPNPGMSNDCDCVIAAVAPLEDLLNSIKDKLDDIFTSVSNIEEVVVDIYDSMEKWLDWVKSYGKPTWYKKWFISPLLAQFPEGQGDGVVSNRLSGWTIEQKQEKVEGFTGRFYEDNILALEKIYEELQLGNAIAALNASNNTLRIEEEQTLESITNSASSEVSKAESMTNTLWGIKGMPDVGEPLYGLINDMPDIPDDASKVAVSVRIPFWEGWRTGSSANLSFYSLELDPTAIEGASELLDFCRLITTLFFFGFCLFIFVLVGLFIVRLVLRVFSWLSNFVSF